MKKHLFRIIAVLSATVLLAGCAASRLRLGAAAAGGVYNAFGTAMAAQNSTIEVKQTAGSAANLYECMQRAVSFGIPAEQAILSATIIPAREIGQDAEIGSIAVGKHADFVVCDAALNRNAVYLGGQAL